jgi:hypothetical protein
VYQRPHRRSGAGPEFVEGVAGLVELIVQICADLCQACGLTEWRQSAYHVRQFKKSYRRVQRLKHSHSQHEAKRSALAEEIQEAHRSYLEQADRYLARARETRARVPGDCGMPEILLAELDAYRVHAERQIDQIRRRVLLGERIPHHEKVFCIFEPHTEWISKGKAGVPVELGLRVAVVEDQHRFILHHRVMEKTSDDQVAVPIVSETRARLPEVRAISLDKGFHSPSNQSGLKALVDLVVLPKKGQLSAADHLRESAPKLSSYASSTRPLNRRSAPWKRMALTAVSITAWRVSGATLHWRSWRAMFSASVRSCESRRRGDSAGRTRRPPELRSGEETVTGSEALRLRIAADESRSYPRGWLAAPSATPSENPAVSPKRECGVNGNR